METKQLKQARADYFSVLTDNQALRGQQRGRETRNMHHSSSQNSLNQSELVGRQLNARRSIAPNQPPALSPKGIKLSGRDSEASEPWTRKKDFTNKR
jgi:hypothetical protein